MANAKVKEFPPLFKRTSGGKDQIWQIWVESSPEGGLICVRFGLVGGKQQETKERISKGKNAGKKNATSALMQALAEAESRWTIKKKRKGYADTADESADKRAMSPMLAHKYKDHHKKVDWGNAFAQPKFDGFRLFAIRGEDGKWTLQSRENQPMDALTHIKHDLDTMNLITRGETFGTMVLDGEAYAHGLSLNEISAACKKKRPETMKVKYHVYDLYLPESNCDYRTRHMMLNDIVLSSGSDYLEMCETVKVSNEADLMQCQAEFMKQGYEGAMLRHGKTNYEPGKRSSSLLKVKTFEDDEFEVIDTKMCRDGKYEGCPVFICVTKKGHTFDVLAPGKVPEKRALGERRKELVGELLTVKYIYYTKTAEPVPFFPIAKGFFKGKAKKKK